MLFNFPVNNLKDLSDKYKNRFSFDINGASTSTRPKNNTIWFSKKITQDIIEKMKSVKSCIIIAPGQQQEAHECIKDNFVIPANNPRLEFAIILQFIIDCQKQPSKTNVCQTASIGENFKIGEGTIISHNVVIGDNVEIGTDCVIMPGVVINDNVKIGNHNIIRENSVIGGYGFGFERDENDIPIRIPHIGGVVIGNNVEIGALSTIVAGTIDPTIIEDYTKIDDHVHIAHNCHIGKRCLITACAEVSGSVSIGDDTWLGPNCSIINGISIGKNCFIGIGAVVKKSLLDGLTVSGNPARPLEEIKEEKDMMKRLLSLYRHGKLTI